MSQITIQVSKQFIGMMFITGTVSKRCVVTKGLPDDAELIGVGIREDEVIEYVYDCPSDNGADRTTLVELSTLDNV